MSSKASLNILTITTQVRGIAIMDLPFEIEMLLMVYMYAINKKYRF
jgi:hypothetical protein